MEKQKKLSKGVESSKTYNVIYHIYKVFTQVIRIHSNFLHKQTYNTDLDWIRNNYFGESFRIPHNYVHINMHQKIIKYMYKSQIKITSSEMFYDTYF